MLKASDYRFRASGFASLVLALILAFACSSCAGEQAGNASSEKEGVGKTETEVGLEATHDPSVQESTSAGATGNVDHYRVDCRMQTYVFKENMSRAQARDFTARVTYRVQANLNGGGEQNLGDILDDLNVPAYTFLCG
jgi:FlaG/FlaF family flagellin (archaellin)